MESTGPELETFRMSTEAPFARARAVWPDVAIPGLEIASKQAGLAGRFSRLVPGFENRPNGISKKYAR